MQHDGAVGGPAHAAVGDPDDVADAVLGQVAGDGDGPRLGHARGHRPDIAQDKDVVSGDADAWVVDA